ncbi:MAG: hypothetical protein K6T31_08470, partial [Alicyclobacillus sp.]|nr:hypothetical protein [Alicyclobacillus sp.]
LCYEYGPYILRRRDPLTTAFMEAERAALVRVLQQLAAGRSAAAHSREEQLAGHLAALDRWLAGGGFDFEGVGTSS